MNPRALADTGALLAVASSTDQHHRAAVEIGQRFVRAGGRLVGTTLVLGELHGMLLRRRGIELSRRVLVRLLDDPRYEWVDVPVHLVNQAIARWLQKFTDQRFSITDAVSFEVMQREAITSAFSFDHDFVTAGFELLR